MKLDLEGRIALVSGASRGIGLAIAKALTAEDIMNIVHFIVSLEPPERASK